VTLFRRQGSPAVRVINASFGKFVRSRTVGLLIRLMRQTNGTVLIGASGNEDTLSMEYPAAFTDAIAVAAVDIKLNKVGFSNFGRWVDISAPGSNILATVPGTALETKSGTSMAAPMVAGVAGLLLYQSPTISFDDLRQALLNSADPSFYSADHEGGFNFHNYYPKIEQESIRQPLLGTGLLNANAALRRDVNAEQPLFSDLNRVRKGCGTVGILRSSRHPDPEQRGGEGSLRLYLVVFALPLLMIYSLQVIRAMLRKRRSSFPLRFSANSPS